MSPLVFLRVKVKVKGEPLHLHGGKAKGDAGKVTPGQPLVQLPSSCPDCEVRSCDLGCGFMYTQKQSAHALYNDTFKLKCCHTVFKTRLS